MRERLVLGDSSPVDQALIGRTWSDHVKGGPQVLNKMDSELALFFIGLEGIEGIVRRYIKTNQGARGPSCQPSCQPISASIVGTVRHNNRGTQGGFCTHHTRRFNQISCSVHEHIDDRVSIS